MRKVNFYALGATFGKLDKTDVFTVGGYWTMMYGSESNSKSYINKMTIGDIVFLKRMNALRGVINIRAIGIVKGRWGDVFTIDWVKDYIHVDVKSCGCFSSIRRIKSDVASEIICAIPDVTVYSLLMRSIEIRKRLGHLEL